jgi:hypothetical protein
MGFGTAGVRNSGGSGGFHIVGYTQSQLERNSFDQPKAKLMDGADNQGSEARPNPLETTSRFSVFVIVPGLSLGLAHFRQLP